MGSGPISSRNGVRSNFRAETEQKETEMGSGPISDESLRLQKPCMPRPETGPDPVFLIEIGPDPVFLPRFPEIGPDPVFLTPFSLQVEHVEMWIEWAACGLRADPNRCISVTAPLCAPDLTVMPAR